MDTVIFLLLLGTWGLVLRSGDRVAAIAGFAVSLIGVVLLFRHHVTSPLDLNF